MECSHSKIYENILFGFRCKDCHERVSREKFIKEYAHEKIRTPPKKLHESYVLKAFGIVKL